MNRYILIFVIFSFFGWVWETIYCTLIMQSWANRGFLFGPVCPIYGFGTICGLVLYDLMQAEKIPKLSWWQVFLIGFFLSMILEYPTSWALEKMFSARWWDYSTMPLNINGRTSIPTSCAFGLMSIFLMKYAIPFVDGKLQQLSDPMMNFLALLFMVIITVDTTLTVTALTDFKDRVTAIGNSFQNKMTDIVKYMYEKKDAVKQNAISRITQFKFPGRKLHIAAKLKENKLYDLIEELNNFGEIIKQNDFINKLKK